MIIAAIVAALALAQPDPSTYDCLRWRCIGPHRGGRTVGAAGIPDKPNTFFIGVNNGGVWKTTDAGRVWTPIFDDQPTGSIGAIAVAPSNPDVLYVGSGEGLQRPDLSTGDGMYRSLDGGTTWKHLGLRDGQQISSIIVDPHNAKRLFVAVLGHPFGPNQERGVFRSLNGGDTFEKVLYKDPDTGAIAVAFDPTDPNTIYADLFESRHGPWENGQWQGPGSGLFKSTDGGTTWRKLTKGLPTFEQGLGRIGFDIAPSDRNRLYAVVDATDLGGIYRSDDAGESWTRVSSEGRLWGRGFDFAEARVDPKNPDIVYVANTSTYRSTDGGKAWTCIKGAPGGDDYHTIWINPLHPEIILLASDQGATISVNGGETWSSWYNQPTAQFYHVITDNQFPYWVYGGQQESGSVGISSRGRDGQITFREWHTVAGDEYAYFAPDPLNPNLVYGGKVTRFHHDTGEVEYVGPDRQKLGLRFLRTSPLIFSPVDPTTLYFVAQMLLRTRDGGSNWDVVSPDLTREHPDIPASVGKYRTPEVESMARRGVIYTVAPSYVDANVIWCGTDDGLIHLTTDGGANWKDVTPPSPNLTAWSKVSIIDAGRFDAKTAYAAVNRIRIDDQKPHIFRTHDGGRNLEGDRRRPARRPRQHRPRRPQAPRPALLRHRTERLLLTRRRRPLAAAPPQHARHQHPRPGHPRRRPGRGHARALLLDPRQLQPPTPTPGRGAVQPAHRLTVCRRGDSHLPHALRPAPGLPVAPQPEHRHPPPARRARGPEPPRRRDTRLLPPPGHHETHPGDHRSARSRRAPLRQRRPRTGSEARVSDRNGRVGTPAPGALAKKGSHRFIWDLRLPRPEGAGDTTPGVRRRRTSDQGSLPISAIWHDTPFYPQGDWVKPGTYTVRLTADGTALEQRIEVKQDPRRK